MIRGEFNAFGRGGGEQRRGCCTKTEKGGVYSNPTKDTWLQFLKMNTFNENKQIFTKGKNSKGNDNNEVNKSKSRGTSSHGLKYRQRENKIKRKPFLSTVLVISLAQSWSLWNLELRGFHQHVQTCANSAVTSLVAGQT